MMPTVSVGKGVWERVKRAKRQDDTGCVWKSVSEKSLATRINKDPFEASSSQHMQYFVRVVTDKRTENNGAEFLSSGGRDFQLDNHDTWEPMTNLMDRKI